MSKFLKSLPEDDTLFADFGKITFSNKFWDRVKKSINESSVRYEAEERLLTPTAESMQKRFDI